MITTDHLHSPNGDTPNSGGVDVAVLQRYAREFQALVAGAHDTRREARRLAAALTVCAGHVRLRRQAATIQDLAELGFAASKMLVGQAARLLADINTLKAFEEVR